MAKLRSNQGQQSECEDRSCGEKSSAFFESDRSEYSADRCELYRPECKPKPRMA